MAERNHRIDNAKGILIFLVVLGHLCEAVSPDWTEGSFRLLLTGIYAFHMPAFVFLAGVTAKSDRLAERVLTFVVYLAGFQVLCYLITVILGEPFEWSWTRPHWILWFLLAMIYWQLTLPLINARPRVSLVVSVLVGAAAGVFPFLGYELSASRALVFWPFFVIGHLYGSVILRRLEFIRRGAAVAFGALCTLPVLALYGAGAAQELLYGSRSFDFLDLGDARGMAIRLWLYAVALLMTVALLTLLPNRPGFVARTGSRSLSVYLLHGFVILLVGRFLERLPGVLSSGAILLLCVSLALLTTWVLSLEVIDRRLRGACRAVVEPVMKAGREALAAAGDRRGESSRRVARSSIRS